MGLSMLFYSCGCELWCRCCLRRGLQVSVHDNLSINVNSLTSNEFLTQNIVGSRTMYESCGSIWPQPFSAERPRDFNALVSEGLTLSWTLHTLSMSYSSFISFPSNYEIVHVMQLSIKCSRHRKSTDSAAYIYCHSLISFTIRSKALVSPQ